MEEMALVESSFRGGSAGRLNDLLRLDRKTGVGRARAGEGSPAAKQRTSSTTFEIYPT